MPKPSPFPDDPRSSSPYILSLHTSNRFGESVAGTTVEHTLKSKNEGSFPPSTLFTASEKLSPGLLTAFNLEYAESSSDMVLVPMHLCMCIHALNRYAPPQPST